MGMPTEDTSKVRTDLRLSFEIRRRTTTRKGGQGIGGGGGGVT
jgi:hypothetical protein